MLKIRLIVIKTRHTGMGSKAKGPQRNPIEIRFADKLREIMANNKLFVSNLSYKTTEAELTDLFSQSGNVVKTHIATDRETGKQRGFGFIEMSTQEEAETAIKQLHGQNLQGREISVVISQPKPRSSSY